MLCSGPEALAVISPPKPALVSYPILRPVVFKLLKGLPAA
jgi:hypothetical protein